MVVFENVNENVSNALAPLSIFWNPDCKYPFELILSLKNSLFPTVF